MAHDYLLVCRWCAMTIRERTTVCLILVCDGCGEDYDGADAYTPHYDTAQEAREESGDMSEWRTDGTSDWCPACQLKHHNFVASEDDPIQCARCEVLDEEHEVIFE